MKKILIANAFLILLSNPSLFAWIDDQPPSKPYKLRIEMKTITSLSLVWVGSGNNGRNGRAAGYLLKRAEQPIITDQNWDEAVEVAFAVKSSAAQKEIRAIVSDVELGTAGYYALRAFDDSGNLSQISESVFYKLSNPFAAFGEYITTDKEDAFEAGHESGGQSLYVCLAYDRESIFPGKIGNHLRGGCHFSLNSREKRTDFSVYVKSDIRGHWLTNHSGTPDLKALPLGKKGGNNLYLCRAQIRGGVHSGYVLQAGTKCQISYGGRVQQLSTYDLWLYE